MRKILGVVFFVSIFHFQKAEAGICSELLFQMNPLNWFPRERQLSPVACELPSEIYHYQFIRILYADLIPNPGPRPELPTSEKQSLLLDSRRLIIRDGEIVYNIGDFQYSAGPKYFAEEPVYEAPFRMPLSSVLRIDGIWNPTLERFRVENFPARWTSTVANAGERLYTDHIALDSSHLARPESYRIGRVYKLPNFVDGEKVLFVRDDGWAEVVRLEKSMVAKGNHEHLLRETSFDRANAAFSFLDMFSYKFGENGPSNSDIANIKILLKEQPGYKSNAGRYPIKFYLLARSIPGVTADAMVLEDRVAKIELTNDGVFFKSSLITVPYDQIAGIKVSDQP